MLLCRELGAEGNSSDCLCFIAATERCLRLLLPLCSHQHEEAERSRHGGAGRVQPVLHAAVAVRPVCAADSGKMRGERIARENQNWGRDGSVLRV